MIIKALNLENYRRFERLEIEFPETVVGIIGRNGSGKSTLIEAISWTLYGNRYVRTDKNDVRSQHVDVSKTCSAEMIFEYGGAEYRIVRKLKGKNATSEAAVYLSGISEPMAVQDRGVNAFIEQLLKLDYRSFTTSIFAKQKELAKLSSMQGEERRKTINRLINLDQIDRAREKVRRDRNNQIRTMQGMQSGLKDMQELKNQKKTFKQQKSEIDQRVQDQTQTVKQYNSLYKAAKTEFESYAGLREKFQNLTARSESIQQRIEDQIKLLDKNEKELADIHKDEKQLKPLRETLAPLPGLEKEKDELDSVYKRYHELQIQLEKQNNLQEHINQDNAELETVKSEADKYDELLEQKKRQAEEKQTLENKLKEWRVQNKQAHADLVAVERRGQEVKTKLEEIKKLGPDSPCPLCTQKLGEHYNQVIQDHEKQLQTLRKNFKSAQEAESLAENGEFRCQKKLDMLNTRMDQTSTQLVRSQQAKQHSEELLKRINTGHKDLKQIQAHIQSLGKIEYDASHHEQVSQSCKELQGIQQTVIQLEERLKRKPVLEEQLRQNRHMISELETLKKKIESERSALDYDENTFQQKKKQIDESAAKQEQAVADLNELKKQSAVLSNQLETALREIKEQKKHLKEIDEIRESIHYMDALDNYFGHFRLYLAGRVRPFIAARASELVKLTTWSRYTALELDEDYNLQLYDGNIPYPLERFSGGEQDLTNLCLRIAISQVVAERSGGAPINFIVLDEIFGSQDIQRRESILNALSYLSSQFRQILIITHIESIQDMLPTILYVKADNDQTSSVRFLA